MPNKYTIEATQFSALGLLPSHNYYVIKDPDGKVIIELHGLATSKNGKVKIIGYLPSDKIRFHEFKGNKFYDPSNPPRTQVVFTGSYAAVMKKVSNAQKVGKYINSLNIPYPFLGIIGRKLDNSNAVYRTLGYAMRVEAPYLDGIKPGMGDILIPYDVIDKIIQKNATPPAKTIRKTAKKNYPE